MYHRQSFPRLGDYIATVLQVTRLTKSIIRISGGIGSDTYNSFKKARTSTLAFTIDWYISFGTICRTRNFSAVWHVRPWSGISIIRKRRK